MIRVALWSTLIVFGVVSLASAAQSQPGSPEPMVAVQAVRLTAPLKIDGQLNEEIYSSIQPTSHFIQQEPVEDAAATEKTDVWVFFDKDTLFLAFRCWETRPELLVANEMRRDSNNIFSNDHVAFFLDTFHDGRNGIEIAINALGGRWDGQITDEKTFNGDWNPVLDIQVAKFDQGWSVEVAIPFKSLRYAGGAGQAWGFNVRRFNRWKNETSFLTRIPRSLGQYGLFHASLAAELTGLETPSSRNLDLKPYAVGSVASDLTVNPQISNDFDGAVGLDAKYGLTQGMTADFTYNTDFAQVEADEQQINLTRFALFFPEKREFFLENQGLFGFGGVDAANPSGDTPIIFYSRRIGFDLGHTVPIQVGGRVTGRAGSFSLGVLNIQSKEDPISGAPGTNFTVARVKQDILRRSSIGLIYTGRNHTELLGGTNQAYGVDGTFGFFTDLTINTYWAQTHTEGIPSEASRDTSYKGEVNYAGDRYGAHAEHLYIGDRFIPDVGFLRRSDISRSFGQLRFSPRIPGSKTIRKLDFIGSMLYVETTNGRVDTRDWRGEFDIEFQNSDKFVASYGGTYEFVPRPTEIVGLIIPTGPYDYASTIVGYIFGPQRRLSGSVSVQTGSFYGGDKTSFSISQGRFNATPQLSIEPTYLGNWVHLPQGDSITHLVGSRITYTMSPTMFVSALVQYNTGVSTVSSNIRLRWEYRPGSELFVVYNDQRDTLSPGFAELQNRAFIVKVNRLFRF